MKFTPENIFFLGAVLIFASIVISKWGYRFGIPTLLLFLFTGMLFGSDGLGLEFNNHEDAQLIGMLSLSVILFSGGMDTKFRDIRPVMAQHAFHVGSHADDRHHRTTHLRSFHIYSARHLPDFAHVDVVGGNSFQHRFGFRIQLVAFGWHWFEA